jgi:hypothetical protein
VNIPEGRNVLQQLVDEYSSYWSDSHSDEVFQPLMQKELPNNFLLRVMRRCREIKDYGDQDKRCYYEHATDEEKDSCHDDHLKYDEDKEHAYVE